MNNQDLIDLYNQAVYDTDRDAALEVIHAALKAGKTPEEIVFEIIIPALDQTVKMIENDDGMCLAQHFMTSQIASEVVDEMLPLFKTEKEHRGTVVIGSAFGDLHSLGKRKSHQRKPARYGPRLPGHREWRGAGYLSGPAPPDA